MNYEENRLCTFDNWPQNAPIEFGKLAKEGFFATGRFLEVECFWCHVRISSWVYGDQIEEKHHGVQPQCPFLINKNTCNNVPIRENENPNLAIDSASSSLPTSTTSITSITSPLSQPSESLYIESNRLATFKNWPNPNISPESLAKAGFYYLNRSDEAKCAWCKGVIAKWEKDDNAYNEHQRFFPHCPRVQLGPLIEMASDGIRDLGIQQIVPPREPKYSSLDARIRTFEKWPIRDIQDPMALAHAGLYYLNISDQVRCFHCDMGLRSWQKDDNPWFEHAKWFPECQFVRLVKGSKYIESVLKASSAKNLDSNCSNQQTPTDQPLSLNEAMSTRPVRQALEIGIDAGAIRNVTQKQLLRKGQPFLSVDELIQAVFDERHEQQEEQDLEEAAGNHITNNLHTGNTPILSINPNFNELLNNEVLINLENDSLEERRSMGSASINNELTDTSVTAHLTTNVETETSGLSSMKNENIVEESSLNPQNSDSSSLKTPTSLEEENRKLKDARLCKVCLDDEVGVVFLPCGHLVTCVQCAPGVTQCPMCRSEIKGYVRTFLS